MGSSSVAAVKQRLEEQRENTGNASARPVYRYTVPPKLSGDIKSVGLVQITCDEELRATKRSRNDSHRLAYELTQQALVEANGNKLSEADGSRDSVWSKMSPKVRNLVLLAYAQLHSPEDDESSDFLKSQEVTVG